MTGRAALALFPKLNRRRLSKHRANENELTGVLSNRARRPRRQKNLALGPPLVLRLQYLAVLESHPCLVHATHPQNLSQRDRPGGRR